MLAKKLVYELRGEPSSCDACDIIKSKAKQIPRSTKGKVTAVGEIMGLDITGPFPITNGTNHRVSNHKLYWCSMIDHYSRKTLNYINIEFTPPDTPKINSIMERGFAIWWGKAKILLQTSGLKDSAKRNQKILIHAIKTSCFLTEGYPLTSHDLSLNNLFYGTNCKQKV